METIDCTVIVLAYNSERDLPALLNSLGAQSVVPSRVLLLDNASADASHALLCDHAQDNPRVDCHRFDTNIGFARAMNWGIAHSSSGAICLVNADTVLDRQYLELCYAALVSDNRIGMAAGALCRLVNGEKTDIIDSLGIAVGKNRHFFDVASGESFQGFEGTGYRYPFGVGGCLPLYSKSMLDDICSCEPPFFELFESYYEDTDLAWRARLAGWHAVCVMSARAWHVREGSLRRSKLESIARNRCHRNRYWVMLLNENPRIWTRQIRYWFVWELFLLFKPLFQPGLMVALFTCVRYVPYVLKQRKKRDFSRRMNCVDEERLFSSGRGRYFRAALERRIRRLRRWFPFIKHERTA